MKIIGFASQMQNGKDTSADYLVTKLDGSWKRTSIATPVKDIFMNAFGVDKAFIEKWKVKAECPEGFNKSVRQSLQFIGDGFRQIKGDIWVELAFRDDGQSKIFSDVRYVNEMAKIRSLNGMVILVWRPGFENHDANGSESSCLALAEYFAEVYKTRGIWGEVHELGSDAPPGAETISFFLPNDGTLEDIQNKIDERLVPYVNGFGW